MDYGPGKAAWLSAGLPSEGELRPTERVGSLPPEAAAAVAVVDRATRVGAARAAAADAGAELVIVTAGDPAVVDGAVEATLLEGVDDGASVASVAAPAPPTVRPALPIRDLVDRLHDDPTPWIVVTTPEGRLVGAVSRHRLLDLAGHDRLP